MGKLAGGLDGREDVLQALLFETFFHQLLFKPVLFKTFHLKGFCFLEKRFLFLQDNTQSLGEEEPGRIGKKLTELGNINGLPFLRRLRKPVKNKRPPLFQGRQGLQGGLQILPRVAEQLSLFPEILRAEGLQVMPDHDIAPEFFLPGF